MSRGPDAATLIERALVADLDRLRCPAAITDSAMTRWASATFAGARHRITLEAACSDVLDIWAATLPEAEFDLRGHLIADLTVVCIHRHDGRTAITLEALSVEAR